MAELQQHPQQPAASAAGDKRAPLANFLAGLDEFKTPVEAISELPKHEKMDGNGSWTEAEMESELLYWVQRYLAHLGCPVEYAIPCARAIVTEVFGGDFRVENFHAIPSQLAKIDPTDGADDGIRFYPEPHHNGNGEVGALHNGKNSLPVVSAKNLYQHAVEKAIELLTRWKENPPRLEPVMLPHKVSVYATRNKRPGMEDRHVVIPDLRATMDLKGIKEPVSFYAVYDGHAGAVAASYCAAHLHRLMATSRFFDNNVPEALVEAFQATDDLYKEKGLRDNDYSGTTAVVAVINDNKLHIAWVGDSEAAIVQNGQAVRLVEPRHIASDEAERARVTSEGGTVIMNQGGWRVGAILTVTRAIGDSTLKPYVTAKPDVRTLELTGNEDYLVIACDGLWDELDPVGAMQETNRFLREHPDRPLDVAKALAEKARKSGSMDNITVLVVMLKPLEQVLEAVRQQPEAIAQAEAADGGDLLGIGMGPNLSSSPDEFADLVDSTDFSEMNSGPNPFEDTPLDADQSGLEASDQAATADTEWTYQKTTDDHQDNPTAVLHALDEAIGEPLLSFEEEVPPTQIHPSSSAVVEAGGPAFVDTPAHNVQTTTVAGLIELQRKEEEKRAEKVPEFVKVFEPAAEQSLPEPAPADAVADRTVDEKPASADVVPEVAQVVPSTEAAQPTKETREKTQPLQKTAAATKAAGKTPPTTKPTPSMRSMKTPAATSPKSAPTPTTKSADSPVGKSTGVSKAEPTEKKTSTATPPSAASKRAPATVATPRPAATPRTSARETVKPVEAPKTPRPSVPRAATSVAAKTIGVPSATPVAAKPSATAPSASPTTKPATVPAVVAPSDPAKKRPTPSTPRAATTAPPKRSIPVATKAPAEKKSDAVPEAAGEPSSNESVKTTAPATKPRAMTVRSTAPAPRKAPDTLQAGGDAAKKSPVTEGSKPSPTTRAASARTPSAPSARLSSKATAKTSESVGSRPLNGTGSMAAPKTKPATPAASARSAPVKKTADTKKTAAAVGGAAAVNGNAKETKVNGIREEKSAAEAAPSQPANVEENTVVG
ncbi:uncharacterized protein LOC129593398 [Paramacrobiotus metropolitanus]|uniref:uncharacterized protein LOC129593398 n=1 Tax=Paramacrobiotus metropolitanus TaxID=2943436 RepID=UPI0024461283|nr:uncharacterized protein LOC129593398 [Paramacrobiotus metropolitanus]XP_055345662.1 uncharacterized protein LOC129593398 [Paramacrobiotus metropolitanus]